MSTVTCCDCPLRAFQISAAASPLAAIEACAAASTRNDDGSTGSVPVSLTELSAAGSPPARDQRALRIWDGVCVIASEAKQSRAKKSSLDCFVASLLAMTMEGV